MRRLRKKYTTPKKAWEKRRIIRERKLLKEYGLKNKRELWKMEEIVRGFRREARNLIAEKNEELANKLIGKLSKMGLLDKNSGLDDVLGLEVKHILERRLQTIVYRKGMANTIKEARKLIVHGHVLIDNHKVTSPSYIVMPYEEDKIKVVRNG